MACCRVLLVCLVTLSWVQLSPAEVSDQDALEILSRVRRVIGGETAKVGEWPYIAHLMGKIPDSTWWGIPFTYKKYYCGGAVINKRYILTAAHCFKQRQYDHPQRVLTPKYWHVKVGEVEAEHGIVDGLKGRWHRFIGNKDKGIWFLHAEKIILHPGYNELDNWANDLALIRVEEDLPVGPENENIGPINLPYDVDPGWPLPGTQCVMKGWGCSSKGSGMEATAMAATMPAVGNGECLATFWGLDLTKRICAGEVDGRVGICRGDSGGPLVCDHRGQWVQAGVASFTSGSRPGKVPGVFTRVQPYLDWIRSNSQL